MNYGERTDYRYLDGLYLDEDWPVGCRFCAEPTDDPLLICDACLEAKGYSHKNIAQYLVAKKEQGISHTSWTDFVLRVLCGVDKLPQGYPLSLTDLIVTPDEINWNDDVIAMALEDYINEDDDSREDYHSWLKERLA